MLGAQCRVVEPPKPLFIPVLTVLGFSRMQENVNVGSLVQDDPEGNPKQSGNPNSEGNLEGNNKSNPECNLSRGQFVEQSKGAN